MDRQQVTDWVAAYERAWRTPGTEALATIFTPEASYRQGPYRKPLIGLPAIARMWEDERDGPDEVFNMTSDVVTVEDDTAVVRLEVRYGDPVNQEYRDLWIVRFAEDGRCRAFEEWPFAQAQPTTARTAPS
ncbi:MAG TPA: nuclear transport factor 2 family protein [Micromonosporaceae bacterium]|nr:nuclear transport factor 2 family protein [Micromonosporaceae bacterium]